VSQPQLVLDPFGEAALLANPDVEIVRNTQGPQSALMLSDERPRSTHVGARTARP